MLHLLCENENHESESAGRIQFLLLFSTISRSGTERLSVALRTKERALSYSIFLGGERQRGSFCLHIRFTINSLSGWAMAMN